jgi:predicted nucleic acid-binding protein
MSDAAPASAMLRLVLDTNVWLDWLVFDDPATAPIKAAVAAGTAGVFIDAACGEELERVLAYPRVATLDAAAQSACLAECLRVARATGAFTRAQAATATLPLCSDADDQKFLELARDCGADVLVTRDHALLDLARSRNRRPPFRILTPRQFEEALRDASA